MSIIGKLKTLWRRDQPRYRVDEKGIYFSETNPFYFATHEDWGEMLKIIKSIEHKNIVDTSHLSIREHTPKNYGELLLLIAIFTYFANKLSLSQSVYAANIILKTINKKAINSNDINYIYFYVFGVLINRFGKLPLEIESTRVYKPDMSKVHPELKKIFLLNLDNVEFKTEE